MKNIRQKGTPEARLRQMEESNRRTLETLSLLSTLEPFHPASISECSGDAPREIIAETRTLIRRLLPFQAMAFFIVGAEGHAFSLMDCEPKEAWEKLQMEKDQLVEDGTFKWLLRQFRPVILPARYFDHQILLHVISTKSRTRGVFIGALPDGEKSVFDPALSLLSIALMNCAGALESIEYLNLVHRQKEELEAAVEERTRELQVAQKNAQKANQAKNEFLSNMSHELRSPLNAIIGFSEVILLQAKDAEIIKFVSKIKDSGRYLAGLIEELLDIDRIESGRIRLDIEKISLNEIVAAVVDVRQNQLPKGFNLERSLDSRCGDVMCDPLRIRQVVSHLLDNAVKFSPDGGTIQVRTEAHLGEIRVSIRDEGIGLSEENKRKVFESFRQVEAGFRRETGGLGVGLSLSEKILALHNGKIWLESEEGRGSTFTFSLPATAKRETRPASTLPEVEPETREPGRQQNAAGRVDKFQESLSNSGKRGFLQGPAAEHFEKMREETKDPWHGLKILIADDLEDYHMLMKMLLGQASQIMSAFNGAEALEIARSDPPDLIIMDLRMPVLDGFAAIRKIKEDPFTRDIPLLGVSAQAMAEDKIHCLSAGADGFVTKPVEMSTLRKEVRRVISLN